MSVPVCMRREILRRPVEQEHYRFSSDNLSRIQAETRPDRFGIREQSWLEFERKGNVRVFAVLEVQLPNERLLLHRGFLRFGRGAFAELHRMTDDCRPDFHGFRRIHSKLDGRGVPC